MRTSPRRRRRCPFQDCRSHRKQRSRIVIQGRLGGAGDGDRTRDVQLGKLKRENGQKRPETARSGQRRPDAA